MTPSHRVCIRYAAPILTATALLSSCTSTRTQSFATSFLPPAPAAENKPVLAETPAVRQSLFVSASPNLLQKMVEAAAPSELDVRIQKADEHFDAGRKFYQQGNAADARREFDIAVELLLSAPQNEPDRQRVEHKLDQLVDTISRYDREGLGAGEAQQALIYEKPPLDGILQMTFPTDPKLKPRVLEEIQATASQLPLDENDAVLGALHYFLTDKGHRTVIAGLRRAGRYRPLIQHILDEEGVPQELIYLAQVESGFLPRAQSYRKAVGMWQFVQFRGREYGLEQTPGADERLDPEKATRAAARHLRDLYTHFGDWYLAMAAYNCGPGCVDRAIQRTGFADFWELRSRNALPRETTNYVPVILALTIMAKNPKDYGLENIDADPPLKYDTVAVTCPTNLALVADALDRPVSEIQELNPSLLKTVAPANFQLHVPAGTSAKMAAALDNIPESHRANWRMHRVVSGETLAEIAKRYATAAGSIAEANESLTEAPEMGDLLVIPAAYQPERTVRSKTSKAASRRKGKSSRIARAVPERVLHHRATRRTYRTASVATRRHASAN